MKNTTDSNSYWLGRRPVIKVRGGGSTTLPVIDKYAKRGKPKHKQFSVATYNVRTLNNTVCNETGEPITNKIDRIIAECEKQGIDCIALQEHRLTTSDSVGYSQHNQGSTWTLAYSNSSFLCHGVALLYNSSPGS